MMNAVGYLRVSTNGQVDKFGLDSQKSMILEYCQKNDVRIMEWYIDKGESGAKESRPEFDRLVYGEAQNPPIEAVIVAKSDRVARDVYIYYAFKHELQKKGIKLISVSEDFGELGPYSVILEAMLVAMAQVERVTITSRTGGGRKVKAYAGGYAGGNVPYGYQIVNHEMEIVEDEAEVVRAVFDLLESGMSLRKVADRLNECGYRTRSGGKFLHTHIVSIRDNRPVYEGLYKYGENMEYVAGKQNRILNP